MYLASERFNLLNCAGRNNMLSVNNQITLDDLHEIEVKRPLQAGNRWVGCKHYDLVYSLLYQLDVRSPHVPTDVKFAIGRGGANCVGSLSFGLPFSVGNVSIKNSIGFANHNDRRRPLTAFFGYTFRCKGLRYNLAVAKHTANRRSPSTNMNQEVGLILDACQVSVKRLSTVLVPLLESKITGNEAGELLLCCGRMGLMTGTRVFNISSEFHRHKFSSVWDLIRLWSATVSICPPFRQMDQLLGFYGTLLVRGYNEDHTAKAG